MIIDIDWLESQIKLIREIEAEEFDNITWVKDGRELEFKREDIKRYELEGLCNSATIRLIPYTKKAP